MTDRVNAYLRLSDEVSDALSAKKAVVALESTIVTHGMPYPQNLETARAVEGMVRHVGAVPATTAILGGRLCVGLNAADLDALAREGQSAAKASRRDIAALLTSGRMAGTTVAATMQIAALAGIAVFATGGIGGVHRGAEDSFDISADLTELGRTPVAVVCAGAKSILDIGKTLEVLETEGVPVLGYRTDTFPAFFTRESPFAVDHRFDTPVGIANAIRIQRQLHMPGGMLIANPVPEADALDETFIAAIIEEALDEAAARGVSGNAVTPYLLQRIFELSDGRSLKANIALVKNNAALAAEIATSLVEIGVTP